MAGTGEPRAEDAQATDQRSARAERIRWGAGWVATLALALWLRSPSWTWLTAAAGFTLLWTLLSLRAQARRAAIAAAVLWFALLFGVSVQLRLGEVARGWDLVRFSIEEDAESALSRDLDALVDRGEAAVDSAIAVARGQDGDFLFGALSRVRERMDVSAVAVFGPDGAPLAWAGEHRGTIPDTVRRGLRPYFFSSGPLFGYLYFTRSFEGGRTAIAAVLLEASVAAGEGGEPFSEVFAERHGITPRFTTPARAQGESVWDWGIDTPILSVSFVRLTQERWRARLFDEGRWGVGAGWLAAVLLLSLSWTRRGRDPGVPAIVVTAGLFLIPLGEMVSTEGLFSPLGFVLPLPVDVTLGEFLILLAGAGVWLLARGRPRWGNGAGGVAVRVLLAGLVLPVILGLVGSSASSGLLAAASAGGTAIFAAGTLALALPLLLLLPRTPSRADARMAGRWWAPAALLSVALGLWVVAGWGPEREVPPWAPVLWALPFALFAIGLGRTRLGKSVLFPWLAAGWIGGTAAASHLWVAHMDARVSQAERELARLGTTPDPYLDFLLRQFSESVLQYSSQGREGVGLLYQAWVSGGLAGEGYEARVTLWQEQQASAELRLSDVPRLDSLIVPMLARAGAAEEPQVERYTA
ncbi:MAG: hypothetical protein M3483_05620, partial [Gemmatimonadota bacterium]|nr:hypothetical protein [Gemmatimonadota bacterium]